MKASWRMWLLSLFLKAELAKWRRKVSIPGGWGASVLKSTECNSTRRELRCEVESSKRWNGEKEFVYSSCAVWFNFYPRKSQDIKGGGIFRFAFKKSFWVAVWKNGSQGGKPDVWETWSHLHEKRWGLNWQWPWRCMGAKRLQKYSSAVKDLRDRVDGN